MLSRYGFEFDTYNDMYWDYISQNPSKTGVDARLLPLYYTSNGTVFIDNHLSSANKYGYIDSNTHDNGNRVYAAFAAQKITAGVDTVNYMGISLR